MPTANRIEFHKILTVHMILYESERWTLVTRVETPIMRFLNAVAGCRMAGKGKRCSFPCA